jgi:hypothetical protein
VDSKQGNGKPPRCRLRACLGCGCGKKALIVPVEEGKEAYACMQLLIEVLLKGRGRGGSTLCHTDRTAAAALCPVRAQGLHHEDQSCRVGCKTRAQQQGEQQRKASPPNPFHVARERQEKANNQCRPFVAKLNEAVGAEVVKDIRLKPTKKAKRADVIVSYHRHGKTGSCGVPVHLLDAPVPTILEALWPKLVKMVG